MQSDTSVTIDLVHKGIKICDADTVRQLRYLPKQVRKLSIFSSKIGC
jgi:hypothetical protein